MLKMRGKRIFIAVHKIIYKVNYTWISAVPRRDKGDAMNHVWGLFSHPNQEMSVIKSENETISHHYTHHVLVMAAVPVICAFIGTTQLGWNFGDGHLNNERLLRIVQESCGFEEGELRVLCVEAQPMLKPTMAYRIYDAKCGLMTEGKVDVNAMRDRQPWDAPTSSRVPEN